MSLIDRFLNSITMYRLVLYYLIFLLTCAVILSFFGLINYSPGQIIFSTTVLLTFCWATNTIFSWAFEATTNNESFYITALILALIISPVNFPPSLSELFFLFWAAVLAMASKYILAIGNKHLFNPAAIAVVLTGLLINQSASWWVGTEVMLPFSIIGFLIVRKIRRFDLVFSFFFTSIITIFVFGITKGTDPLTILRQIFFDSPILFLAFVMLTEPLTSPPTKFLQAVYGGLVGFLFAPQIHLGSFYTTPELALVIGNLYSYLVSPKMKLILKLKQKIKLTADIYDFVFVSDKKLDFKPGQYLEWTLELKSADSRGNRRYFTISSSPTENEIRLGVKLYSKSSSFKTALLGMKPDQQIIASQLAGDFTLPKNQNKKLVFIAGGIGITPFRSMLKYLIDKNEKRDIVLFFSNKDFSEIIYSEIFNQAQKQLGIPTIYTLTDATPANWSGEKGRISPQMIEKYLPDFKKRFFYLSGPHNLVSSFEKTLALMGIAKSQIIIDYFPGFA